MLFQVDFFSQMQGEGFCGFLNKLFVFSLAPETQYYFVQTALGYVVYHYDSNVETVKVAEWELVGSLRDLNNLGEGCLKYKSIGNLLEALKRGNCFG